MRAWDWDGWGKGGVGGEGLIPRAVQGKGGFSTSLTACSTPGQLPPAPAPPPPGLESPKHYAESLEGLRVIQLVRPTIFNFVVPKLMRTPLQVRGEGRGGRG